MAAILASTVRHRLPRLVHMEALGGSEHRQHVLCALPYPEPKDLTSRLQEQFPNLKVTYKQITNINVAETDQDLAEGTEELTCCDRTLWTTDGSLQTSGRM